jgi:hypothetical protein
VCRQQKLSLSGKSPVSPTIKKTTIFVQIIIIVGVADSGGSGSKFIVASIIPKPIENTRPWDTGVRFPRGETDVLTGNFNGL